MERLVSVILKNCRRSTTGFFAPSRQEDDMLKQPSFRYASRWEQPAKAAPRTSSWSRARRRTARRPTCWAAYSCRSSAPKPTEAETAHPISACISSWWEGCRSVVSRHRLSSSRRARRDRPGAISRAARCRRCMRGPGRGRRTGRPDVPQPRPRTGADRR